MSYAVKKKFQEVPPEFRRYSTPPTSEMLFWDDLELPGHRWCAQLPKLVPGRRFVLAPPTESRQNSPRFEGRSELCIPPSSPRQASAGHRPLLPLSVSGASSKRRPSATFGS